MGDSLSAMSDADLKQMAANFFATINGAPTTFGLTAAFATDFSTLNDDFADKLSEHVEAQNTAKARTALKQSARQLLEAKIREARLLAKAAKIPEGTYAQMGIPSSSDPSPANATVPAVAVDTSERLRHTLSWTDAATTDTKKKPVGAMGAEIWVKIDGPPPADEKDCVFLTLDAFTPYVAEYGGDRAGKTAHYMVRWRMRDGSLGAWGETVSATITG